MQNHTHRSLRFWDMTVAFVSSRVKYFICSKELEITPIYSVLGVWFYCICGGVVKYFIGGFKVKSMQGTQNHAHVIQFSRYDFISFVYSWSNTLSAGSRSNQCEELSEPKTRPICSSVFKVWICCFHGMRGWILHWGVQGQVNARNLNHAHIFCFRGMTIGLVSSC